MLIDGIALEGWKKEPESDRDFNLEHFKSAITNRKQKNLISRLRSIFDFKKPSASNVIDLRASCSIVENQRSLNSCTGNAVVGGLELLENLQGMNYVELSRLFPYYNGRILMDDDKITDEGCYIRLVMMSLLVHGVCAEEVWPYNEAFVNKRPSNKSYITSYAHKIKSFYKITSTGKERCDDIKFALRSSHPVVFGAEVSRQFLRLGRHGMVSERSSSDDIVGRHAMLIVGFDEAKRIFIVRNSWGTEWGDNGYCYYTEEFLDEYDAEDFWVPTSMEAPVI